MKWTLSGICYYLIWFFAVGTTACTTSRSHAISRADFERVAKTELRKSAVIHPTKGGTINVDKSSTLYVHQRDGDLITRTTRRVAPFAFVIDKDLVTPIPVKNRKAHESPFTLTPNDHFEVRTSKFAAGRTIGMVGLIVVGGSILFMGLAFANSSGCINNWGQGCD